MFHNDQEDDVEFYAPAFKDGLGPMQQSAIEQFLNNERSNVDYEILHTVPKKPKLRSIRYSAGGRLLFVKRAQNGKKKWLILEDLPTHKHKTSHFMRPHVLANFLNMHVSPDLDETSSSADKETPVQKDQQKAPRKKFRYQPVFWFGQEILTLIAEQTAALHTKPPLIIDGAAGTGKTCIAWALLETLAAEDAGPVIYLAQSEQLVKRMREDWNERPIKLPTDRHVQFFTYEEYAKANCPELLYKKLVDKTEFKPWFKLQWAENGYLKNWNQQAVKDKDSEEAKFLAFIKEKDNDEKVYEEFRILSGHSEKEYLQELGERESLFDKAQRPFIVKLFKQYKKHLDEHQMADLAFHKLNLPTKSDTRLIVDEALDLSHGQIDELIQATPNIYLCNGILQNLKDRISNRTYQEKRVKAKNGHVTLLPLKKVLRQGPNLTSFANLIAWVLCKLRGGISHKNMPYNMQAAKEVVEKDSVHVIEDLSADLLTSIKATYLKSDIAYIVPAAQKAAMLEHTTLVYTADEIKGLQYPCVIDLDTMQDQTFSRACKKLASLGVDWEHLDLEHLDKNGNRAKRDEEDDSFDIEFHKFYTAVTRATGELYIVQKRGRDNALLFDLLKRGAKQSQQKTDHKPESAEARAKAEAEGMFKRALELRRNGDIERAMKIREELTDAYRIEFDLLAQETNSAEIAGETSQAVAVSSSPEQTRKSTLTSSSSSSSPVVTSSQSSQKKPTPPVAKKPNSVAQVKAAPAKTPIKATPKAPLPKIPDDKQFKLKNVCKFLETDGAAEALFALDKTGQPAILNFLYLDWKSKIFIEALQKPSSTQPNQKLITNIPFSFFCNTFQLNISIEKIPSAFSGNFLSLLACMPNHSALRVILLNQPIELAAEIAKAILQPATLLIGKSGNSRNPSCFEIMSDYFQSCGTLSSMQDRFNIASFLSPNHLYTPRKSITESTRVIEFSVFVSHTQYISGTQFLLKAYQANPKLLEGLPEDQLLQKLTSIKKIEISSPFANLLSFPDGRALLDYIYFRRREKLQSMQHTDLSAVPFTSAAETVVAMRDCHEILSINKELQIFYGKLILNSHSLLINPLMHPPLLKGISAEEAILSLIDEEKLFQESGDHPLRMTSPIYRFSSTKAGKDIFGFLLQLPSIQQKMKDLFYLKKKHTDSNDEALDAGDCIYDNLYFSKTGRKILTALNLPITPPNRQKMAEEKPNIDNGEFNNKIEKKLYEKSTYLPIGNIFRYCAGSTDGFSIDYIELVLTNPLACKLFFGIASSHPHKIDLLHNLMDLILPNGKSCLAMLCRYIPRLITVCCKNENNASLNVEKLHSILDVIFGFHPEEAPSNFFWLVQMPHLRTEIPAILKANPTYRELVTIDKIMEQVEGIVSEPIDTLKAHLEKDEAGKQLMQLIGLDRFYAPQPIPASSDSTLTTSSQTTQWTNLFTPPGEPAAKQTPEQLDAHGELRL